MTKRQQEAARQRHRREREVICPLCDGSGRVLSRAAASRARRGGNASYLKSLQPGQPSMQERGRKGGRPKALTLADLDARSEEPKEVSVGAPGQRRVQQDKESLSRN